MWAGVQNVSRPIDRCQAMSQWDPTIAEVTAMTADQTYHGTADSREGVIGLAISTVLSHVGQEWNRGGMEAENGFVLRSGSVFIRLGWASKMGSFRKSALTGLGLSE